MNMLCILLFVLTLQAIIVRNNEPVKKYSPIVYTLLQSSMGKDKCTAVKEMLESGIWKDTVFKSYNFKTTIYVFELFRYNLKVSNKWNLRCNLNPPLKWFFKFELPGLLSHSIH